MTFTATLRAQEIERGLRHATITEAAAELDRLRIEARLLFRSYAPCVFRQQQLLRIEYRLRMQRARLRVLMSPHPTDTRGHSLAAFGCTGGPQATWAGQL